MAKNNQQNNDSKELAPEITDVIEDVAPEIDEELEQLPKRKVRVLVDCAVGKPNDVVELSDADIQAHAGEVDANEDSVAYAESLK